jgi:hypothetical protein
MSLFVVFLLTSLKAKAIENLTLGNVYCLIKFVCDKTIKPEEKMGSNQSKCPNCKSYDCLMDGSGE